MTAKIMQPLNADGDKENNPVACNFHVAGGNLRATKPGMDEDADAAAALALTALTSIAPAAGVFVTPDVASSKKRSRNVSESSDADGALEESFEPATGAQDGSTTADERELISRLASSQPKEKKLAQEARRKLSFTPTKMGQPLTAAASGPSTTGPGPGLASRRTTRGSSDALGDIEYSMATDIPLTERQQISFLARQMEKKTVSRKDSKRVNARNERGETPLHRAAIKGDLSEVQSLIKRGADINSRDHAGWSPLHEASNHGFFDIVCTLIEAGANIHAEGLDLDTPLHDAAVNGHFDIVKYLLEKGADAMKKNRKGKTPVDYATNVDNMEMVKFLEAGNNPHYEQRQKRALPEPTMPPKDKTEVADSSVKEASKERKQAKLANHSRLQKQEKQSTQPPSRQKPPPKSPLSKAHKSSKTSKLPEAVVSVASAKRKGGEAAKDNAADASVATAAMATSSKSAPKRLADPSEQTATEDSAGGDQELDTGVKRNLEDDKSSAKSYGMKRRTKRHRVSQAQAVAVIPEPVHSTPSVVGRARRPSVVVVAKPVKPAIVWAECVLPGTEDFAAVTGSYERNLVDTHKDDDLRRQEKMKLSPGAVHTVQLERTQLARKQRLERDRLQLTMEQQLTNQMLCKLPPSKVGHGPDNACQMLFNKRIAGRRIGSLWEHERAETVDADVQVKFARLEQKMRRRHEMEALAAHRAHMLLYPSYSRHLGPVIIT